MLQYISQECRGREMSEVVRRIMLRTDRQTDRQRERGRERPSGPFPPLSPRLLAVMIDKPTMERLALQGIVAARPLTADVVLSDSDGG